MELARLKLFKIFSHLFLSLFFLCYSYLPAVCDPAVIAIAGGGDHSLTLKSDGTVWACGLNGYGQLGNGTNTDSTLPLQVGGGTPFTDVVSIAGGGFHSLALKSDGTVWAWGLNNGGQLGNGTNANSNLPLQVGGGTPFTDVVSIAGGGAHSLALKSDGTVWAWGINNFGQLGNGTNTSSNLPVQVGGGTPLTDIIAIAGGGSYSLAVRSDGTVWMWGANTLGQLGNGTNTSSNLPVQVGGGTPLTDVIAIAGGYTQSLAVRSDGTVWAWGGNSNGQLGNGTNTDSNLPVQVGGGTPLTDVIAIAGGNEHSLALRSDGTVWAWGGNNLGQLGNGTNANSNLPLEVGGGTPLTNVIAIAAGINYSLALQSDETVWAWGENTNGQLGNGTITNSNLPVQTVDLVGIEGLKAIASGSYHSLALRSDGTVWAWGFNGYGELGNGTNTDSSLPVQVGGGVPLTNVVAIAAGREQSLALKSDGTVWAWGGNANGQLGNGTTTDSSVPVQVGGGTPLTNVSAIEAGGNFSLALKADGTAWAWGDNTFGQLGNGTNINSSIPIQVGGGTPLTNVSAIEAGGNFSLALKADGTAWAWGDNTFGQLGNGTNNPSNIPVQVGGVGPLTNIIALSGGSYHSLALREDGTVWAWGDNADGQLGNGTNAISYIPVQVGGITPLTNAIAISAGGYYSLALIDDGTVQAWGYNSFGQLGNGTNISANLPVQVGGGTPFTTIKNIAARESHVLALKSDGSVWAWGDNNYGQLGNGTTTFSSSIPVETIFTPVVIATPANQTIVSGETTSILLGSNISGTTFSWTVSQNNVSGAANGAGTTISQTLITTANAPGTATYTITPISPQGCIGTPMQVVVTVEPVAQLLAITSSNAANFVVGQPSSFTVTTAGSPIPSLIVIGQLPIGLAFIDNGNGTATLFGTPVNGTQGVYSLTIVASNGVAPNAVQNFTLIISDNGGGGGSVNPPRHVRGSQGINLCNGQADFVNTLTWNAPSGGNPVVAYYIYRNSLNHLVKVVPAGQPLQFKDRHRQIGRVYTYFIVAVDASGNVSEPINLVVRPRPKKITFCRLKFNPLLFPEFTE
ncbi:PKD-like domain-containing protein [Candidatus Protochlamydia phocaeensis]|uniref:RCC1 domain-containing protein n=1 Tax=Candidatus Protochlamydia phocaeensis TaxID=1414722 RepID=UPI0008384F6D|nr:PKD-like domain-containing protein [Candidatus Protochlamydia phocaeensis]